MYSCAGWAYLILFECGGPSAKGAAFFLAAELLRWPAHVACSAYELWQDGGATLPPVEVHNKYFDARVCVRIGSSGEPSECPIYTTAKAMRSVLAGLEASSGVVVLVDGTTEPNTIPWHCVPEQCLFRVVMGYGLSKEQSAIWYDACVSNGFEYVSHREDYEVLAVGVERSGLLCGDLSGASRLSQIMHNTLWPKESRITKHVGGIGDDADATNVVAVVSTSSVQLLEWLASSSRLESNRYTALETVDMGTQRCYAVKKTPSPSKDSCAPTHRLLVANSRYATVLEVEYIHPVMLFPAMSDLFLSMMSFRRPGVVVLCWPPHCAFAEDSLTAAANSPPAGYPPLEVFINQLQRSGASRCVVVVSGPFLSPTDERLCIDCGVVVIRVDSRAHNGALQDGEVGRLLQVLHSVEWPLRSTPFERGTQPGDDEPHTSVPCEKKNSVLLWACASCPEEEEGVLQHLATGMKLTLPDSQVGRLLAHVPSLMSSKDGCPMGEMTVRNRYFEADISVHCFGGLRALVAWERAPTPQELLAFGVVVVATNVSSLCEASRGNVLSALHSCCEASFFRQRRRQGKRRGSDIILQGEYNSAEDLTSELCAAAEDTQVFVLYITDGNESDESLVNVVEELLNGLQEAVGEWGRESSKGLCGNSPQTGSRSSSCGSRNDHVDESFLSLLPVEVVYGAPHGVGVRRLQEAVEQHVWPMRRMRKDSIMSNSRCGQVAQKKQEVAPSTSCGAAAVDAERVADVTIGCEIPPHYLVDPLTLRSVAVEFLRVEVPDEEQNRQLIRWIDNMKHHGHLLPTATRQRQAAVLTQKLGKHLQVP
ncbi:hypothetical protein ERJ75_001519800 [Trypanosoma vivax]|uniref:Uncharacterized protein n=1 Tax=Trypanosoma vivax (strain Y486) TaxID=1055687 RepID=G0UBD0_TRYVY|nr:hypothetical protein ERJ75_001521200 [Trypanosoma vivax]KAH8606406.1 hypothetical protein ERJ75_001519800 [Trypanosoma vivax]CCC53119.1 conserved hypothetical protein [Trypanosoma vivax Y486]